MTKQQLYGWNSLCSTRCQDACRMVTEDLVDDICKWMVNNWSEYPYLDDDENWDRFIRAIKIRFKEKYD